MDSAVLERPNPKAKAQTKAPVQASPAKPAARVITLRHASARDLTPLYDCLIQYFAECAMFYPPPVEKDVISWGLVIVNQGNTIVAECDGRIVGSLGLELGICPWNHSQRYLNAVWTWVLPEFRNGSTGVRLLKKAKEIADALGLFVRLDEIWAYEPFLMGKLKERLGFHRIGGNYGYFPTDPNRDLAEK